MMAASIQRLASGESFKASDMQYRFTKTPKPRPEDPEKCPFGKVFTDHMLSIEWSAEKGWGAPLIKPVENISLHPATSVFHYATELFEGLKAYRTEDNRIAMFRPMENMKRMERSAQRACLPTFDKEELLKCLSDLIRVDQEWVPYSNKASLYIRPTMIGTETSLGVKPPSAAILFCILCPVGPYFSTGTFNPISLMADPRYIRAAKGGSGAYKLGSNYGPTIEIQQEAIQRGCQQVLWLHGPDHEVTEVGTMNVFIYWINEDGDKELVTMPLNEDIVLPGITRSSLMELAHSWGEFKVKERIITMKNIIKALEGKRLLEMFGTGTACVVCPINHILYEGCDLHIPTMKNGPDIAKRLYQELTDIQLLEMFGTGTACVVCPINHILYEGCDLHIPTMKNGPDIAKRLYQELTDIQYGRIPHEWSYTVVDKVGNEILQV